MVSIKDPIYVTIIDTGAVPDSVALEISIVVRNGELFWCAMWDVEGCPITIEFLERTGFGAITSEAFNREWRDLPDLPS